jgi:hypothetical protein
VPTQVGRPTQVGPAEVLLQTALLPVREGRVRGRRGRILQVLEEMNHRLGRLVVLQPQPSPRVWGLLLLLLLLLLQLLPLWSALGPACVPAAPRVGPICGSSPQGLAEFGVARLPRAGLRWQRHAVGGSSSAGAWRCLWRPLPLCRARRAWTGRAGQTPATDDPVRGVVRSPSGAQLHVSGMCSRVLRVLIRCPRFLSRYAAETLRAKVLALVW